MLGRIWKHKSVVVGVAQAMGLVFLMFSVAGCLSISNGRPDGSWHDAYQPILDADSEAFIALSLERARQRFGEPMIPVKQVLLRRSKKRESAKRYRIAEDFSLTECADSTNGVFVIYLAVDPGHRNYYALLGHECAHLINPQITDWYMEGFATVFSEEMCAEADQPWGDWKRHFMRSRRDPYALSYRMMLELKAALPTDYPKLLGFTAANKKRPGWRRIDIDAWLAQLSDHDFHVACDIIEPYVPTLDRAVSRQYDFTIPNALE